jgi:orotidine-5'-phosphate decarboxylase
MPGEAIYLWEMPETLSQCIHRRTETCGNNVCLGLDPVLSRIPFEGTAAEVVEKFCLGILDACLSRGLLPAAIKPNVAYFEALGLEALARLPKILAAWGEVGVHTVLDAKRGDIGRTSAAYAQAAFGTFGADTVTVAPYMGRDSVEPFLEAPEHSIYLLLRTSNKGARDFQDLEVGGEPLYLHVARTVESWKNSGSIGFVVGATVPEELERIAAWFHGRDLEPSFLVPGVSVPGVAGGQGGGIDEVVRRLRAGGLDPRCHLVNSSSGIDYAWERTGDRSAWAAAAVQALADLAELAAL